MLPSVSPHHANVVVHSNQTVVRHVGTGCTLVNGAPVSVAALRHGDVLELGGRRLRWEYTQQRGRYRDPLPTPGPLVVYMGGGRRSGPRRRSEVSGGGGREPALRLALELAHRASMPAVSGTRKQVAIVQPQRRDADDGAGLTVEASPRPVAKSHRPQVQQNKSRRSHYTDTDTDTDVNTDIGADVGVERATRRSAIVPLTTTKAALWIESRKANTTINNTTSSASRTPRKKTTNTYKINVAKIGDPPGIDHTKQAAIMLMTGHTPKSKLSGRAAYNVSRRSTPGDRGGRVAGVHRKFNSFVGGVSNASASGVRLVKNSTPKRSPSLPNPRKSAMKNPSAKKGTKKTESIKFDLSNLENYTQSHTSGVDTLYESTTDDQSETVNSEHMALHYTDTPSESPASPTRSTEPSTEILQRPLGATGKTMEHTPLQRTDDVTMSLLASPRPRKSSRGSFIVQRTQENKHASTYSNRKTKTLLSFSLSKSNDDPALNKMRTLTPKKPVAHSYSVVDLVSVDSEPSSVYNSLRSSNTSDVSYVTPRSDSKRSTRSTIAPALLASSTPYVQKGKPSLIRSKSSSNITREESSCADTPLSGSPISKRTSNSLTVNENTKKVISLDSTTLTRVSRSRASTRLDESELLKFTTSRNEGTSRSTIKPHTPDTRTGDIDTNRHITRYTIDDTTFDGEALEDRHESNTTRAVTRSNNFTKSTSNTTVDDNDVSAHSRRTTNRRTTDSRTIKSSDSISLNTHSTRQLQAHVTSKVNSNSTAHPVPTQNTFDSDLDNACIDDTRNNATSSDTTTSRRSRSQTSIVDDNTPSVVVEQSIMKSNRSTISNTTRRSILNITYNADDTAVAQTDSPQITNKSRRRRAGVSTISVKNTVDSFGDDVTTSENTSVNSSSVKNSSKQDKASVSTSQISRSSRNTITDDVSPQNSGTVTPENKVASEEATTPVLSIQRLLDSSLQDSPRSKRLSKNIKTVNRNTVSALPLSAPKKGRIPRKAKSLSNSTHKISYMNNDGHNLSIDNDENITPRSTVKLVQEAVKNKHSTAKKPKSKRSIIDVLDESDIVKDLFNSPVKRKLTQSMTEYSRKRLFIHNEDGPPKKRTRKTIAFSDRTPDDSIILDTTDEYTPQVLVCPLVTPAKGDNLTGFKRLFQANSPVNDLRHVKGVRRLLRTPRNNYSPKNDLTNVSGVKLAFARSPNRGLDDVMGVKNIFRGAPNNDLKRISGVRSLFRNQNVSPKNDLSDVTGVKNLFVERKSPRNDLRNVSGVKTTMEIKSPNNDLTQVHGIKRIFGRDKRDDLHDVSGVEELFYESSHNSQQYVPDTDVLFDRLIGKPAIKTVYSKSFNKQFKKVKGRKNRSLKIPAELAQGDVESWLQEELNRRTHAASATRVTQETKKQMTNRSKLDRELMKLSTATIAGCSPIVVHKIRHVTAASTPQPVHTKSGLEEYGIHCLPIKKRSLIEKSSEEVHVNDNSKCNRLPIKKRALVHSTPLKGKLGASVGPAELSRVSPIAGEEILISSVHEQSTEDKPKRRDVTKLKNESTTSRSGDLLRKKGELRNNTNEVEQYAIKTINGKENDEVVTADDHSAPRAHPAPNTVAKRRTRKQVKVAFNDNLTEISQQQSLTLTLARTNRRRTQLTYDVKSALGTGDNRKKTSEVVVAEHRIDDLTGPRRNLRGRKTQVSTVATNEEQNKTVKKGKLTKTVKNKTNVIAETIGEKITRRGRRQPTLNTEINAPTDNNQILRDISPNLNHKTRVTRGRNTVPSKSPKNPGKGKTANKLQQQSTEVGSVPTTTTTRRARKSLVEIVNMMKPRTTRTRVLNANVVVSKPSPVRKPNRTRRKGTDEPPLELARDKPAPPKPGSSKSTASIPIQPKVNSGPALKTRTRQAVVSQPTDAPRTTRAAAAPGPSTDVKVQKKNANTDRASPVRRDRKKQTPASPPPLSPPKRNSRSRKRKIESDFEVPAKVNKTQSSNFETRGRRGRPAATVTVSEVQVRKKGLGDVQSKETQVQEETQSGRGKRLKATSPVYTAPTTRRNKTTAAVTDTQPTNRRGRGRR